MTGENCSANCPTKSHESWGECQRAKNIRVMYCQSLKNLDLTTQKSWDRELDAYQDAKRQGIQPDGTTTKAIEGAVKISNDTGVAYDARKLGATPLASLQ